MKHNLLAKTVAVMFVTVISKIIGFLRTAVLASVFGATWQTDSFYMAQNIVGVVTGLSSSGLTSSLVPIRTKMIQTHDKEYTDRFSSSLINIVLLMTTVIALLVVLLAPFLVNLFAPSFIHAQHKLASMIVQLLAIIIIINAVVAVLSGILNSTHNYLPAQLVGFPLSILAILFAIYRGNSWGIYAMVAGFVAGSLGQVIVLVSPVRKVLHYSPVIEQSPALKETIVMSIPIFISSYVNVINQAIDNALASGLQEGSISAISYANQLVGVVIAIIITPITTTLFTSLSELTASGEYKRMKDALARVGSLLIIVLSPITLVCMLLAKPIVSIVYERMTFNQAAVELTTLSFFHLALSLVAIGHQAALSRCFYAIKDSKTPLIITAIGVMANVVLNLILVGPMQIAGLSLATSLSHFLICGMMLFVLRRKIGPWGIRMWLKDCGKVAVACIVMGFMVDFIFNKIPGAAVVRFFASCGCGFIIYLLILWFLDQREIRAGVHNMLVLYRKARQRLE